MVSRLDHGAYLEARTVNSAAQTDKLEGNINSGAQTDLRPVAVRAEEERAITPLDRRRRERAEQRARERSESPVELFRSPTAPTDNRFIQTQPAPPDISDGPPGGGTMRMKKQ